MKFVRTEDLKAGMRLAKPIYNKKGVLLYERNSALTAPGIASAKNFGLIGVYILEPAEPLPPLSLNFPVHLKSVKSAAEKTDREPSVPQQRQFRVSVTWQTIFSPRADPLLRTAVQ